MEDVKDTTFYVLCAATRLDLRRHIFNDTALLIVVTSIDRDREGSLLTRGDDP